LKKYIDLEDMVNLNCSNVLDIIQKNGVVSRKEITRLSGLSWGGMTKIVNKLLENGYITEQEPISSPVSKGRTASLLSINTEKNFIIGFDLNQTGLTAVLMNLAGEITDRFSASASFGSRRELEDKTVSFLSEIFKKHEPDSIIAIGVAMQGIVDNKKGICERSFPGINAEIIPIKELLEKNFNVKIFVEHDPDCILYSHLNTLENENAVLLRIDKGIGMAVAIAGKIVKGKGIFEIGHNMVIPDGIECRCGRKGCLSAYAEECFDEDNKIITEKTGELILPLAITLHNLSNLFNTDKIILTGELMERNELFENKLSLQLEKFNCKTNIKFSPISDYAVKGAGLIAIKKSIASIEI